MVQKKKNQHYIESFYIVQMQINMFLLIIKNIFSFINAFLEIFGKPKIKIRIKCMVGRKKQP